MPLRNSVSKLEDLSINQIENILRNICLKSANYVSENFYDEKISRGHVVSSCLERVVHETQDLILTLTPHYLQSRIVEIILTTLSSIYDDQMIVLKDIVNLTNVTQADRRKTKLWRQALSHWSTILCSDNVTKLRLGPGTDLGLVISICDILPDIRNLRCLDLQPWPCAKHKLLNNFEEFSLMFLPHLTSLSLTDVDLDTIINISVFCPDLTHLAISKSEISDEATCHVSKLRKLRDLNFHDVDNISEYGFATLLHNLSELRSIGRCDSLPRALEHNFHDKKVKDGSQQYLLLEEIHCESPVTEEDLGLFVTHCPNVSKLKIVYKPNELQQDVNSPQYPHLSQLSLLKMLTDASIISADFFNHSVFSALQLSGRRLTKLELVDCDEMNLNSLIMIGDACPKLTSLIISCCHFMVDAEQRNRINELCSLQTKSQRKSPFFKLRELKCIFTSPVHLVMLKYLLHFAHNVTTFSLELLCQPLEDSFINSLVNWGSWNVLDTFLIHKSPNLSLMTANTILGSCAKVKKIGSLSSWGHVDRDQLKDFKQEIKRRNFDIIVE